MPDKSRPPHPEQAIHVAVLAFDGISPFHLSVPCMVFGEHHGSLSLPAFKLDVCLDHSGKERRGVRTNAGFDIHVRHGLANLARADMLVIPSWHDDLRPASPALLKAIQKAHQRGARIIGLCLGAFVLAQAGLLDGRSATTHWALSRAFSERYPQITLDPNVLYVDHGDVITSAGTAAGIDCCLHVLRTTYGADSAAHVARRLVVAPHRQGGQAQYIEQPLPVLATDTRLNKVLEWMLAHLAENQSLDQLAQMALMSRRSFTRHFQQQTGTTVGKWLLNQRLAQAQRQLETSKRAIDDIAIDSGFGSGLLLRRYFAREFAISPSAYRRNFQGNN
ncbi:helix-turn-helix domain-containing protein [Undibacterium sp. TS12]|uniref:GlxA family transcriptional regulator n=1 Tax=Undibacterium sp. TS12 TaxID=2908202 RepID=UPI001F4C6057|nr:helix-turn-helix domain-containing protein [Undibacterium sp. TS12]MCH8621372.1 helix-turn-helix domain-containing protein [Undibacterium sp. TS12]